MTKIVATNFNQNVIFVTKNWNPGDMLGDLAMILENNMIFWVGPQWQNSALKANAQSGEARQTHLPRESLGGWCVPLLWGTNKQGDFEGFWLSIFKDFD